MPPKQQAKTKQPVKQGKAKPSGGKQKIKKWTKGRTRDKLQNKVFFDQDTFDKLISEIPSYRLITPAVISDRLKINGSLARVAIQHLCEKELIKKVDHHSSQQIYSRDRKSVV